jgi:hypothetical protein
LIHEHLRQRKGIIASAFTSDSKEILVAGREAMAQFWNVEKGFPVGQAYASVRSIPSVAISPVG